MRAVDVRFWYANRNAFQSPGLSEHPLGSTSAGSPFLDGIHQVLFNYVYVVIPPCGFLSFGRELGNDEFLYSSCPADRSDGLLRFARLNGMTGDVVGIGPVPIETDIVIRHLLLVYG